MHTLRKLIYIKNVYTLLKKSNLSKQSVGSKKKKKHYLIKHSVDTQDKRRLHWATAVMAAVVITTGSMDYTTEQAEAPASSGKGCLSSLEPILPPL